jgi:hypothetical protein
LEIKFRIHFPVFFFIFDNREFHPLLLQKFHSEKIIETAKLLGIEQNIHGIGLLQPFCQQLFFGADASINSIAVAKKINPLSFPG